MAEVMRCRIKYWEKRNNKDKNGRNNQNPSLLFSLAELSESEGRIREGEQKQNPRGGQQTRPRGEKDDDARKRQVIRRDETGG